MFSSAWMRERGSRSRSTESRHTIDPAGACASQRSSRSSRTAGSLARGVGDRVPARPPVRVARDEHVLRVALEERARDDRLVTRLGPGHVVVDAAVPAEAGADRGVLHEVGEVDQLAARVQADRGAGAQLAGTLPQLRAVRPPDELVQRHAAGPLVGERAARQPAQPGLGVELRQHVGQQRGRDHARDAREREQLRVLAGLGQPAQRRRGLAGAPFDVGRGRRPRPAAARAAARPTSARAPRRARPRSPGGRAARATRARTAARVRARA